MDIGSLIADRRSSDVISCSVDGQVREAVRLLASKRIGALPVMEDGKVVGIFSERDVIYRLAEEGDACLARPVGDVMTSPPITVDRATKIDQALALMTKRRIRHLPVVDGAAVLGVISIGDLVKSVIEQQRRELGQLQQYIVGG